MPRRDGKPRHDGTPSRAAALRSGFSFEQSPTSAVLSMRGHLTVSADLADRERAPGLFEELDMLGVTVAAFRDPADAEKVAAELRDDYEFVRDFRLRLPDPQLRSYTRLAGQQASDKLSTSDWPENAGIAEARRDGTWTRGAIGALTPASTPVMTFTIHQFSLRQLLSTASYGCLDVYGFDTDSHITCRRHSGRNKRGIAPGEALHGLGDRKRNDADKSDAWSRLNWLLAKFAEGKTRIFRPSSTCRWVCPRTHHGHRPRRVRNPHPPALYHPGPPGGQRADGRTDWKFWRRSFGYPALGETLGVGAVDFGHQVASFSGTGVAGPIEAGPIWWAMA